MQKAQHQDALRFLFIGIHHSCAATLGEQAAMIPFVLKNISTTMPHLPPKPLKPKEKTIA